MSRDLALTELGCETAQHAAVGESRASAAALELIGVFCERAGRSLFAPIDLHLGAGSVCWLRGANGAGKTTLLRALAGLPVGLHGAVVRRGPAQGEASAGDTVFIGHSNALSAELAAGEALRYLCGLHGHAAGSAAIGAALVRFGLGGLERRRVGTLSQGQRRKLALARLPLALHAPLWLLDEPYEALDEAGVGALDGVLSLHAAAGGITILTSHTPPGVPPTQAPRLMPPEEATDQ